MSNTYKHQYKYIRKDYDWWKWRYSREPREALERQFDPYSYATWNSGKKWAKKYLWKKFRQQVKKKLHAGDYDTLDRRPLRYAWIVW